MATVATRRAGSLELSTGNDATRPLDRRLVDIQTSAWVRKQTQALEVCLLAADDTGSYLGILMHRDDERSAILESPEFSLNRLSYLHLDIYSATVGARVRICFDTYRERLYRLGDSSKTDILKLFVVNTRVATSVGHVRH